MDMISVTVGVLLFFHLSNVSECRFSYRSGKVYCGDDYRPGRVKSDTICYEENIFNALPEIHEDEIFSDQDSIFFIDTTCKGGLNKREVCSVEAAARFHPDRKVYVFFAGPVAEHCLRYPPMNVLEKYDNVHLHRIKVNEFIDMTPIGHTFTKHNIRFTTHNAKFASNILKFVTLYKFGGIYLDLDMLLLKSLDMLLRTKNLLGYNDYSRISIGDSLIATKRNEERSKLMKIIMKLIKKRALLRYSFFDTSSILREAVCKFCKTEHVSMITAENCPGMNLVPTNYFYQVDANYRKERIFQYNGRFYLTKSAYAIHTFGSETANLTIKRNSIYGNAMESSCPLLCATINIYKKPKKHNSKRKKETSLRDTEDTDLSKTTFYSHIRDNYDYNILPFSLSDDSLKFFEKDDISKLPVEEYQARQHRLYGVTDYENLAHNKKNHAVEHIETESTEAHKEEQASTEQKLVATDISRSQSEEENYDDDTLLFQEDPLISDKIQLPYGYKHKLLGGARYKIALGAMEDSEKNKIQNTKMFLSQSLNSKLKDSLVDFNII